MVSPLRTSLHGCAPSVREERRLSEVLTARDTIRSLCPGLWILEYTWRMFGVTEKKDSPQMYSLYQRMSTDNTDARMGFIQTTCRHRCLNMKIFLKFGTDADSAKEMFTHTPVQLGGSQSRSDGCGTGREVRRSACTEGRRCAPLLRTFLHPSALARASEV